MTENRATTTTLSNEERKALLAQLPDYMEEAVKQTGRAIDLRVRAVIVSMNELRTMLQIMSRFFQDGETEGLHLPDVFDSLLKILPDEVTDGGLADIGQAVYETALPILVSGMESNKKRSTLNRATLPGLSTEAMI